MARTSASKIAAPRPSKPTRRSRRWKLYKSNSSEPADAVVVSGTDMDMDAVQTILVQHKDVRLGLIPTTMAAAEAIQSFGKTGQFIFVSGKNGRIRASESRAPGSEPEDSAFAPDLKGQLLARGLKQKQLDLRAGGGTFDLDQVRELMHDVTAQAVGKRVREGSLLAVPGPSNRRRYPTVQFMADGAVVPGLKAVASAFPGESPWMLLNFLVNPDPRLDERKPIDVLKAGEVDLVVESARRVGQQGA